MQKNNKNTKKKRNGKKNALTKSEAQFLNTKERIFYMKDIVPAKVLAKCKFLMNSVLVNAGFNTASKQLAANGAFDPDPSLGSAGVAGFTEWANFYHRYRVWEVASKCTFANRDAFPVMANLGFEPDVFAANAKTLNYYETENQVTTLLPAYGPTTKMLRMKRKAQQVVGDVNCMTDQGYTGTTGTNPSSLWYTSISASVQNLGAVFVLGVVVRYEVEYLIEFYERKQLAI